jgi:hypothetical protein
LSQLRRTTGRKTKAVKEEELRLAQQYNSSVSKRASAGKQWPPPATDFPQFEPLAMPRSHDGGLDEDVGASVQNLFGSRQTITENTNLIFQFPPLPHVKAMLSRRGGRGLEAGGAAQNNGGIKAENASDKSKDSAGSANGSDATDAGNGIGADSHLDSSKEPSARPQFTGRGSTTVSQNSDQFLNRLPSGDFGTLRVRKSGKMELVLGDYIFDVTPGPSIKTHGEFVHMNLNKCTYKNHGISDQRYVVTPSISNLLNMYH